MYIVPKLFPVTRRPIMNNLFSRLLLVVALLAAVVLIRPELTSSTTPVAGVGEEEDGGPGHPGWFSQWTEMRKNAAGIVPEDYLKDIYLAESQRWGNQKTAAGELTNVVELGPFNVGGRTRALIVDVADHDHLLAGGISGGIWSSTDRGVTWTAINDQAQSLAVTYLSQDPNQPNEIYFSTGEVRGNSAGISGAGVFKSTDGGATFNQLPATTSSTFNSTWRVQVSPVEPGLLYVATRTGGLQRSTDGGATFTQAFGMTNGMEVSDVEVFSDSSVLIGVRTQGIFYSPDGTPGSFTQVSNGLPGSGFRRVEIAYCDSFPNVVYSAFESSNGSSIIGTWKSTDQGQTWAPTGSDPENTINFSFPWYCLLLAVQPNNPDFVIAAGQQIAHTSDGGDNWAPSGNSHVDYHSAAFDRDNPQLVYIGNDGGVWQYSTPFMNGNGLDLNDGYVTTQFYAGAVFPQDDIMGGTQDNGTHVSRAGNTNFDKVMGGDGSYCAVNQQDPNIAYASFQNGQIRKTTNALTTNPNFTNVVGQLDGNSDGSIDDGAWFINPYDINPVDGSQLYYPTRRRLWRTTNDAGSWEPITSNIGTNGTSSFCVGISHDANPTVYVGGSSAMFYRIDNAATAVAGNEVDLRSTAPGSVTGDFMACIQVHPTDASTVLVTFTTVNPQPRIWRIEDADSPNPNWIPISGDLPASLPVNWVAMHPNSPDSALLAATDYGLYSTTNGGTNWVLEDAIPNVPVFTVKIRPSDLAVYAFTHGRGIWSANFPVLVSREATPAATWTLYPNPTSTALRLGNWRPVGGAETTVEIIDGAGRKLYVAPYSGGSIDVSELANGVYFLRTTQGEHINTVRFAKQ